MARGDTTVNHVSSVRCSPPDQVVLDLYHRGGTTTVMLNVGASITVGRRVPADVVIEDPTVSRTHARFTWDGAKLELEDLESTNGISINNKPVDVTAVVLPDDVIKLGAVRVVVSAIPPARKLDPSPTGLALVFKSGAMRNVVRMVDKVAQADIPVLIHGETGTGKELIAQSIHERSSRRDGPLVAVNCGSIPHSLMESTLFGHEKGSFTGASQTSKGVFEEADGGTLFLDELGELPPASQAALLRVLETQTVNRVGSRAPIRVDVRVIAATHRDLKQMCQEESFREDLLFRVNTVVVEVPALRDRPEDIDMLAAHFLALAGSKYGRTLALSEEALALLKRYEWPGNVRELRNEIERAVVLADEDVLSPDELSPPVRGAAETESLAADDPEDETQYVAPTATIRPGASYKEIMNHQERQVLLQAFFDAKGNQSKAARLLKMPPRSFGYKFKLLFGDVDRHSLEELKKLYGPG